MIEGSFLNENFNNNYIQQEEPRKLNTNMIIKSTPVILDKIKSNMPINMPSISANTPNIQIERMQQQDGFFDFLFMKKREMVKTIILALTVVTAFSIHSFFAFWIKSYTLKSKLTLKSEMLLRLLYPLIILIIIWFMKAFIL
jgi:hypothetical protein